MKLSDFETAIDREMYEEMSKTFEKLNELAGSDHQAFSISEKKALERAQKAFEKYLEAELIYQEILVYPVKDVPLRNIKRYVQKTLCEQRIERLKESIEYHQFE